MCGGKAPEAAPPPAAPPPPPEPAPEETDVGSARKAEEASAFGPEGPTLRVDRSLTSGGVAAGGTGLRM